MITKRAITRRKDGDMARKGVKAAAKFCLFSSEIEMNVLWKGEFVKRRNRELGKITYGREK